jgi:FAD binding domain
VQDAYNLAWKLAYVLRGEAGPGLLDSYDAERSPIGKQIVLRANKSIEESGPIFEALGFADTSDTGVMYERMRARADDTPEAARQREKLRAALELKDYEFNAHGVELGQRYRSSAVVPDGTPEPEYTRDPELYYHPTTWPGCRLPHCWLGTGGHKTSTHDLVGKGRFALLTRNLRPALGAGGSEHLGAARDRDRRVCDRSRARIHRSVRRLGTAARGRRGRLRPRAAGRSRGVAGRRDVRRPRGGAARGPRAGARPGAASLHPRRSSVRPAQRGADEMTVDVGPLESAAAKKVDWTEGFDVEVDIVVVGNGADERAFLRRWRGTRLRSATAGRTTPPS